MPTVAPGSALWVVQQVQAELGLPQAVSLQTNPTVLDSQLLALLNSGGLELRDYYPWRELVTEWIITTQPNVSGYDLPADFAYFTDQTQWDRTNHWPLLGPKSGQEWQWLKGGLVSQGPRMRYRLMGTKFQLSPIPGSSPLTIAMEYIKFGWVHQASGTDTNYCQYDTDGFWISAWLLVKFLKLKFWETKGFDTTAFRDDFLNFFTSKIGKNMGAPTLTMSPRPASILIGPNNIPDGSWPVGSTV